MNGGWIIAAMLAPIVLRGEDAGLTFFESNIRPVLVAECYDCHHENKAKGGLALDSRGGWMKGGDSGPAIVPGKPEASLLIRSIRHEDAELKMPAKAPKLSDEVIAHFVRWIQMGAPDPRETAQAKSAEKKREWPQVMQERAAWWCFQPLAKPASPAMPLRGAIDGMIQKRLDAAGLSPAPRANRAVLIRRLHYALTGLPPSPEQVRSFEMDTSADAFEKRVDACIKSAQFGEHWARHWMDVVHYSETHGSESDALIPFAWRYRDYLIRAFNADVPYDQLVREHVAGDLIANPRHNHELHINESAIGTAFWRFVEFYHTPVDVKREEVAVIDGQIDTFGKTFQALTLSCARCHDHKFDPIGNADFYALYGILASTRTAMTIIDDEAPFVRPNEAIKTIKEKLRPALAGQWRLETQGWPDAIRDAGLWLRSQSIPPLSGKPDPSKEKEIEAGLPRDPWKRVLFQAARKKDHALAPLAALAQCPDGDFPTLWTRMRASQLNQEPGNDAINFADFRDGTLAGWRPSGAGLPKQGEARAGTPAIATAGLSSARAILERGYHSDVISDRHAGGLRSPDFIIEKEVISVLARGGMKARLRLVIENFQGDSVLFSNVNPDLESASLRWYRMSMKPQWMGRRAYLELLTRDDKPNVNNIKETESLSRGDGRSGFGIARVLFHSAGTRLSHPPVLPAGFWERNPASFGEAAAVLTAEIDIAIQRWKNNECADADARLLSTLIESSVLDLPAAKDGSVAKGVAEYRKAEAEIPIAQRAPGVTDGLSGHDSALFSRGDHTKPETLVPRRFLEVLHSKADSYAGRASGRLALAEELVGPGNPLTARVMANRVWHWLLGRGLVSTVDNFGRMGAEPTHPDLLDHLAREFISHGWSMKYLIREIVLSDTWQRSSLPPPLANETDPGNQLWSHANLRRLEAEAIRDTLLAVAGNLKIESYGPSVRTYYKTAVDSDKQPPAGPLDGGGRRSLYLEVRRNFPSGFLLAFDFPKPVATTGRRSETNVPAQSLALMNDPFVKWEARLWAERICQRTPEPAQRIVRMYEEAFGRSPSAVEIERALAMTGPTHDDIMRWAGLAHALMNMKELIYLP